MPKLKSAHMKPVVDPNFQSRLLQPLGFKENRSCVSQDSPEWFKTYPGIATRVTPHNPDANTNVNLFLKVTADRLNPDGSRRKGTYATSASGYEDTAVSAKAPEWFHVSQVSKVDTEKFAFYDAYVPEHHAASIRTTSSQDLPAWAQLPAVVPKAPPRVAAAERLWRPEWTPPEDAVKYDRDSATSKDAPDFFHIPGVPRARPNAYGGYDFDYDHGSPHGGKTKKGFEQQPPVQINARRHQQQHQQQQLQQLQAHSGGSGDGGDGNTGRSRSNRPTTTATNATADRGGSGGNGGGGGGLGGARPLDIDRVAQNAAAKRRDAEQRELLRAIKAQKSENLRLLSEHIALHERKMTTQQRQQQQQQEQQRDAFSPSVAGSAAASPSASASASPERGGGRRGERARSESPQRSAQRRSTALW